MKTETIDGETGNWMINVPTPNFEIRMGEDSNGLRLHFTVKKTYLNRFKYWLFCKFFPFKIIEWSDAK